MALPSEMPAAVRRETKAIRNAAARARRGAMPSKATMVTLYDAKSRTDGSMVVMAISASDPARGYLLTTDGAGEWACSCFNARWLTLRGGCAHVAAIRAAEAREA